MNHLLGSAYGTRTRAPALRGPCPNRLDERAKLSLTAVIIGESSDSSTGFALKNWLKAKAVCPKRTVLGVGNRPIH